MSIIKSWLHHCTFAPRLSFTDITISMNENSSSQKNISLEKNQIYGNETISIRKSRFLSNKGFLSEEKCPMPSSLPHSNWIETLFFYLSSLLLPCRFHYSFDTIRERERKAKHKEASNRENVKFLLFARASFFHGALATTSSFFLSRNVFHKHKTFTPKAENCVAISNLRRAEIEKGSGKEKVKRSLACAPSPGWQCHWWNFVERLHILVVWWIIMFNILRFRQMMMPTRTVYRKGKVDLIYIQSTVNLTASPTLMWI